MEGGSGSGRLALKEPLAVGDRIRIQFKSDDERHAMTVRELRLQGAAVQQAGAGDEVELISTVELSPGDLVFKVGGADDENQALASPLIKAVKSARPMDLSPTRRLKPIVDHLENRPASRGGAAAGRKSGTAWPGPRRSTGWKRSVPTHHPADHPIQHPADRGPEKTPWADLQQADLGPAPPGL